MSAVGPLTYFAGLAAAFIAAYLGLRLGVKIGRHQEYLARTTQLLEELVWIESACRLKPPVAHAHLADRTAKLLDRYGLGKRS